MREQPEEDDICLFSLDAEALYPSLDTMACSKLCGEMVKDSKLEVSGMDPKMGKSIPSPNMLSSRDNPFMFSRCSSI